MSPRSSVQAARSTRESIIERAVERASVEGLEGLTIGHLAADLKMSKAGVIGQFGSKQSLQLAALKSATETFRRIVWEPALEAPRGRARLQAISETWTGYLQRAVFPGGCFLAAASCEFDGRPGAVRDAVKEAAMLWHRTLLHEAEVADRAGELPPGSDPQQIAFMFGAIALGLNQAIQLLGDQDAAAIARTQMRALLGSGEA